MQTALGEVETRKKINDTADVFNDKNKEAIRREVASDLKAEYLDFMDSVGDLMDDVLGEIYREKIKNIFRILEKKRLRWSKTSFGDKLNYMYIKRIKRWMVKESIKLQSYLSKNSQF